MRWLTPLGYLGMGEMRPLKVSINATTPALRETLSCPSLERVWARERTAS